MIIKESTLRSIIRETINTWHKNHYTSYDDPWNVEDEYEMDVDVQNYSNVDGTHSVKIDCKWDPTLSEPVRVFKTQEDANAYQDKKLSNIYRSYLNSGNL